MNTEERTGTQEINPPATSPYLLNNKITPPPPPRRVTRVQMEAAGLCVDLWDEAVAMLRYLRHRHCTYPEGSAAGRHFGSKNAK